ncbi:uncharacterized protein [Haliotis cracherodii]|uniref:uncharacterized protein n=1 Tax=Haliotis cracherodii TaxID=6455 RepID=UPI0039EA004E
MATSVAHINRGSGMRGCPLVTDPNNSKEHTKLPYGQTVIVPHPKVDVSLSEYLSKKKESSRNGRPLCHVKDWNIKNWKLALTEMEHSNPLFDILLPSNPAQVLIPIDAACDPSDARTHIAATITRVLGKETCNPFLQQDQMQVMSTEHFMDIHTLQRLDFTLDGKIKNISKSDRVVGVFVSRQPLSRSNHYFEVEVLSQSSKTSLVMGCMFDVLFSARYPMDMNEQKGGAVEGLEIHPDDVFGFGIDGEWESEYVPREGACSFYLTKNGTRMEDKDIKETPHIGMYPLVTIIGEGIAEIKLKNLNSPPQSLVAQWEKDKKTFEPNYMQNMLCDEEGVLSYAKSYKTTDQQGCCINLHPITKINNSCTIQLVSQEQKGRLILALGSEKGIEWMEGSAGFNLMNGTIIVRSSEIETNTPCKVGDKVTMVVSGFITDRIQPDQSFKVTVLVNSKEVGSCDVVYRARLGHRCVFQVCMDSDGHQVKVLDYRKPYRSQPSAMDKLTMGRANYINVYDDGTLQYRKFDARAPFGLYVSKTPLNAQLRYFEMQIQSMSTSKHIGIGLCDRNYIINNMPGWLYGSIAYHADNGQLYHNSAHGSRSSLMDSVNTLYGVGDVVGCGIVMETTKLTEDGRLQPQQMLDVYFTKNGVKVHEAKFSYQSDGLFPCVALHHETDRVQLANYFPGCYPVVKQEDDKTQKQAQEKAAVPPDGCQFVVVSVASGEGSDEKAKLQLIENSLDLQKDITMIADLKSEVQRLEKKLASLDFQGQNYYSRLCWNLECLQRICQHKDRLHFMSVNVKSGKGYDMLVEKLIGLHESHRNNYPMQYDVHTFVLKGLEKIVAVVGAHSIVSVSSLQNLTEDILNNSCQVYTQAVKILHNMGQLLHVKFNCVEFAVDRGFLQKMFDRVASVEGGCPDKRAVVVGEATLLWEENTITSAREMDKEQTSVLKHLLLQMGLLRVPCLRTDTSDPSHLFTLTQHVATGNTNMSDYWAKGKRPADSVLMWRTYKFGMGMPTGLLTVLVTLCSQFSRLQLMMKEGGVFQSGAVQTTIVKHTVEKAVDALTIESKCFVPDSDVGPINDDTRYHVEEYTWNVFCILADVIDSHLESCGLLPIIQEDVPHWFANTSVGCKHEWKMSDAEAIQSICTLCNLCCDLGSECKYNGIMGQYLRQCECGTKVTGCKSCGICRRCAQHLWTLRTLLRPCCEVSQGDKSELTDVVPLDGVMYNQVDCISLQIGGDPICLKKQNETSGALVQVFPGPAVVVPDQVKLKNYNKKLDLPKSHQLRQGDTISITLHEIQRNSAQQLELEVEEEEVLEVKPVYHTLICREARVWHDTGIVCYDSTSSAIPVAQFIAARPLTSECNKFSLEIMNQGVGDYIAIGLVHRRYRMNRQPGWDPSSIGFHADDGGVFVGSGWPLRRTERCHKGDIMTCELDWDEQKVSFSRNDKVVYTSTKMRVPTGGFFPCVGLHSKGEAVRLLDLDPWLPPKEGEMPVLPPAFDTYKYGNLWISPGLKLPLQRQKQNLEGWLILHNPSKDLVGYVVKSTPACIDLVQHLDPGASRTILIDKPGTDMTSMTKVAIAWFALDSGKMYTETEIADIYSVLTAESYHTHVLKVKVIESQVSDVTRLKRSAEGEPDRQDQYELQVRRNGSLVDSYYLPDGSYTCVLPTEAGPQNVLLRYPRFPTFDLPNIFQRGMRLIAQPTENTYAECVIADVTHDGLGLTLEFSPKDHEVNTLLCVEADSPAIQLEHLPLEVIEEMSTVIKGEKEGKKGDKSDGTKGDKPDESKTEQKKPDEVDFPAPKHPPVDDVQESGEGFSLLKRSRNIYETLEDDKETITLDTGQHEKKEIVKADVEIYGFENRGNMVVEKRAYMLPPPCLLTQGSQYAIMALDSGWRANSLESLAKCDVMPTRLTVQELQIADLSRKLSAWSHGHKKDSKHMFVFLPGSLDTAKLCHAPVLQLYKDIEVHRLCFRGDHVNEQWQEEMSLDVPLHFVDIPPIPLEAPLPLDLLYASLNSGWTYTALTATKLNLPVYHKMFSGVKPDYNRQQVEHLLSSLLKTFAAQCHIFAEQQGGMDLQARFEMYGNTIMKNIKAGDVHLQKFSAQCVEDPSVLVMSKFKRRVLCKAHLLTSEMDTHMEMTDNINVHHFQPYQETVNTICRELPHQTSFSDDFFPSFPNLQVFSLDECGNLTSLPEGVSKCARLKIVSFTESAIKELPSDIFLVPSLIRLNCHMLPVTSLPNQWPASSQLTHLELVGLQLTQIPAGIGSLQELVTLNLSSNPLADIPLEIGQLKKLKILNLSGMAWITLGGSKTAMSREQYDYWFDDHKFVETFLPKLDIQKTFKLHDVNKNGMLDEEELAVLNLQLFWDIPRIGSTCITDEEYGGIPAAVFQMGALEELYLDYTAITAVPVHMCRLVNLRVLSLEHCPLLESLPGSLGHLPNMKTLDLIGCPALRTPPNEVVSRGFESVKAYLKRLAGGFTACRRTKLMLVGLGGAGKTSLLKALMSHNKKTEGTKGEEITDGIVIQPWTVKTDDEIEITYNTWDFAGQTLYYNTHQFFLSKRAVYILLWSTRQGFEHAGLDFWLSSIACHAPKTPIFVVGTHCDQVPKADIPVTELTRRYPQIAGFHFISSITGMGVAELEKQLLKVTLEQKNMGEKIPQVWLNLEKKILAARSKTSILKWDVIKEYGMEVGIYDEKDIKEAVQFLHELGTVQYFDNDFLRDQIVINPQWIVNVMSCVVSVKNSPIQDDSGRFHHKHISDVWKEYPPSLHKWLLQLTEEFDLTFPLPKEPVNIVPCLLPPEEPAEIEDWAGDSKFRGTRQTKMVYKFAYLPAGLFNRAQVRLFQFSDGKLIWKRGSLLNKNNHLALIRQISDSELVVLVQGPRPENILFLVHEIFESLIEESFHGVVYDFLVPCPDCVMKEGCLEPCLFDNELIAHAKNNKAPFLQCRKYFHTVSMAQLLESMPNTHAGDFDAHLQHSLMMLQELNSALTTDVAVLYSASDVPAPRDPAEKINPLWFKEELEKGGLSCWYSEDMLNISVHDLTLALKNSKVVVALVSDNFERDEMCRDMMLYTMDTLNKDYIITVIGTSLAWQNTDLGMRIGKQEQMVMVKTKARFEDRVKNLQSRVKHKLHGIQIRDNKEYPVCFISYCWSNSSDAVNKGTKSPSGSLGWGDPRVIKKYLEDNGISTWIDHEQMTAGKGLFENISRGMRHAKVLVVCVSDEYLESDNCMMELRFGVLNLGLPLVLAVVGTGTEWKLSEVGILAQRAKASKVYFQKENPTSLETLLEYVKERLPLKGDSLLRKEEVKKEMSQIQKQACKQTNVVFQEEYELTQRRFMRHIISFITSMDSSPMPRLAVIDFMKHQDRSSTLSQAAPSPGPGSTSTRNVRATIASVSEEKTQDSFRSSFRLLRPSMRPKTASRTSRDRLEAFNPETDGWESESFGVRLLCEFEEGWHLCDQSFPLRKTEEFVNQMKKVSPYLARIYAILRQSSMQLNCLSGDTGKQFLDWVEQEAQGSDFLEAYQSMRTILLDNEKQAESFLNQLSRCHLPSGKVFWLCDKHQSGPRITKLSRNVGTRLNQRKVVFREDLLLKELIEKSDVYRRKRGEKPHLKKGKAKIPFKTPTTSKTTDTAAAPSLSKSDSRTELMKSKGDKSRTTMPQSSSSAKTDNSDLSSEKRDNSDLSSEKRDNSDNNMAPVRSSNSGGKSKSPTAAAPPSKMPPINRKSSKSKFKATGVAAELSNAGSKKGKTNQSKACSLQ